MTAMSRPVTVCHRQLLAEGVSKSSTTILTARKLAIYSTVVRFWVNVTTKIRQNRILRISFCVFPHPRPVAAVGEGQLSGSKNSEAPNPSFRTLQSQLVRRIRGRAIPQMRLPLQKIQLGDRR